jgi:hypothetical protein
MYKLGEEPFSDPRPAGNLILNFYSPELWENKFLLFKLPILWYFVTVAYAD